jgi:hypothetical protein
MSNSKQWEMKLESVLKTIILIVGIGVILHTPVTVWLSSLLPDFTSYIKAWKEVLLFIGLAIAAILIFKYKKTVPHKNLMILVSIYALLHLLMIIFNYKGLFASIAGLMIDLRYLVYFAMVLFAINLEASFKQKFLKIAFIGAGIVTIFALLQVYILPNDFLSLLGYSKATILPYMTIDQNENYIRINSTLRGPNPLGAYAIMTIAILASWLTVNHRKLDTKKSTIVSLILVGGLVALWSSYSRSALLAAVVAIVFLAFNRFNVSKKNLSIFAVIAVALGGMIFAMRGTSFVSQVFLHDNTAIVDNLNSNEGHASSLATGWDLMVANPFGVGVGTTGSASMHTESSLIIENQYLFVAHEVGWLGLALFLAITVLVSFKLWKRNSDWLSISVLASGIGIYLIGFFLPVWADDTVSIIWWGLAAAAISGGMDERITFDKKTKRIA